MNRHRLELFSDGVFAIILTLLALDLKLPSLDGVAGFLQVVPELSILAAAFFVVGFSWIFHHNALATVESVNVPTLAINLLALFWLALLPFEAKIAGSNPIGVLGAAMMSATTALYSFSILALPFVSRQTFSEEAAFAAIFHRRLLLRLCVSSVGLVCCALCWLSPWFGYAFLLTPGLNAFLRPIAQVFADRKDQCDPSRPSEKLRSGPASDPKPT